MKIALVGYGKMGKAIERIALERGHEISYRIDSASAGSIGQVDEDNTDVAIEFTGPEAAYKNLEVLLSHGVNTISGSTGWIAQLETIRQLALQQQCGFLWASNYSIGVNLFFELNACLARLMHPYKEYVPSIEEIHHTQKLDAPSGTAITLAEQVLGRYDHLSGWTLGEAKTQAELSITAIRQDPAPGTHTVSYRSAIDDIEIRHTAHSREGFALGAVIAAEFIHGKKGIFTMQDVLFGHHSKE